MLVGQVTKKEDNSNLIQNIISGVTSIPFGNKNAMKFLQEQDPVLQRVKTLLLAGEGPHQDEKPAVKRYMQKNVNVTLSNDGCLVVSKLHRRKLIRRTLLVVPEDFTDGLLHGLHLNLNHPSPSQLQLAVDTKFFILNKDKKIREISENCTLCRSVAKIPLEIHSFEANKMPDHPGFSFTTDVVRIYKKVILIAVENFSGFITTTFLPNEKSDSLLDGLIQIITPFKASSNALVTVRSDQAPGFKSLNSKNSDLSKMGIKLELGNAKNKNAVAIVDRKIQELEMEIKKLSTTYSSISVKLLARATEIVNEKIRSQGLSSKEIIFCRDQSSHENLQISDSDVVNHKMGERETNNVYSAASKAKVQSPAVPANAKKGNLVFLKQDGNKLKGRDLYLVTNVINNGQSVIICKIISSMGPKLATIHPQSYSYEVKQTDIYLAPNQPIVMKPNFIVTKPLPTSIDDHPTTFSAHINDSIIKQNDDEELWEFPDEDEENFPTTTDYVQQNSNSSHKIDDQNTVEESAHSSRSEPVQNNSNSDFNNGTSSAIPPNHSTPNSAESTSNAYEVTPNSSLDIAHDQPEPGPVSSIPHKSGNPSVLPNTGDLIEFWDGEATESKKARVINMHPSVCKRWPGWRNVVIISSTTKMAINLDPYSDNQLAWRHLPTSPQADKTSNQQDAMNVTKDNLIVTIQNELYTDNSQDSSIDQQQPTNQHPDLTVPENGQVIHNRVYMLPDPTDHLQEQDKERRKPTFAKKLNPFKKKNT